MAGFAHAREPVVVGRLVPAAFGAVVPGQLLAFGDRPDGDETKHLGLVVTFVAHVCRVAVVVQAAVAQGQAVGLLGLGEDAPVEQDPAHLDRDLGEGRAEQDDRAGLDGLSLGMGARHVDAAPLDRAGVADVEVGVVRNP